MVQAEMPYDYESDSDSDSDPDLELAGEDEVREDANMGDAYSEWGTNASYYYDGASVASHPSSSAYPGPPSTIQSASTSFPASSAQQSNLSSFTSYEQNVEEPASRSASPSSVISITESLETRIYRYEHGRSLNNYSDVYRLPADEEELSRLDKQHLMFIDIMGAKYPPPMGPILESSIAGEKKVLDLGAGNGACVVNLPPNFRSEVDDINMGLQHFYDKFDVVHCRLIASGIKDYQLLIEHISRVLRPGGLIELAEFDFAIYDGYQNRVKVSTRDPIGAPWFATYMAHSFLKAGKPLLLGNGVLEEEFDIIEQNAIREIHESEIAQYTRLQCVFATKRYDVVLSETFAGQEY
ncbi:hypothetical protein EST38_g6524 [Candolleomyces aberdarensis]|uniref:Methyltransferase domain-containing protein n=1 Tax=Candolleomyces aberdarensis TaxID=2316362 RepID=A0A4V1Q3P7_9AGAR|nr:hypothetical protein EST38_g6524 [Candolleomyces aberdarensis]